MFTSVHTFYFVFFPLMLILYSFIIVFTVDEQVCVPTLLSSQHLESVTSTITVDLESITVSVFDDTISSVDFAFLEACLYDDLASDSVPAQEVFPSMGSQFALYADDLITSYASLLSSSKIQIDKDFLIQRFNFLAKKFDKKVQFSLAFEANQDFVWPVEVFSRDRDHLKVSGSLEHLVREVQTRGQSLSVLTEF